MYMYLYVCMLCIHDLYVSIHVCSIYESMWINLHTHVGHIHHIRYEYTYACCVLVTVSVYICTYGMHMTYDVITPAVKRVLVYLIKRSKTRCPSHPIPSHPTTPPSSKYHPSHPLPPSHVCPSFRWGVMMYKLRWSCSRMPSTIARWMTSRRRRRGRRLGGGEGGMGRVGGLTWLRGWEGEGFLGGKQKTHPLFNSFAAQVCNTGFCFGSHTKLLNFWQSVMNTQHSA